MGTSISDSIAERNTEKMASVSGKAVVATGAVLAAILAGLERSASWAIRKYLGREATGTGEVSVERFMKAAKHFGKGWSGFNVPNENLADTRACLNAKDVMYTVVTVPGSDAATIFFKNDDKDKVVGAIDEVLAGKTFGEVAPSVVLRECPDGKVGTIRGLSAEELALFRLHSTDHALRYASVRHEDGKHSVIYAPDMEDSARRSLLDVGWTMGGPDGARVREQLAYHLFGIERMKLSLDEGKEEAYFVCHDHPERFVHITGEGYSLHDGEKVVRSSGRDNVYFAQQARADIAALGYVTYMKPELFDRLRGDSFSISPEVLKDQPVINVLPPDFQKQREMDELNSFVRLVGQKAAIDNEGDTPWGIGDMSVSYSEYSAFEHQQDIDAASRRAGFERFKGAALYRRDELRCSQIGLDAQYMQGLDKPKLEGIISRAEKAHDAEFQKSMGNSRPRTPRARDD